MNLETVLKKARETKAEIDAEYTNATALNLDDAELAETYIANVKRLAEIIETKANILEFYIDHYNARREYPRKATALDLCDDAVLQLNTLRDIIDRAIDDDESVYCSEANANEIIKRINWAIEHISDASTFARDRDAN